METYLSDKAQAAMDSVIEKMQAGDLSPIVDIVRFKRDWPSDNWSLRNQFLAWMQCGHLNCRNFQAWKKVGRYVKKGGKAIWILAPLKRSYEDADGNTHWYVYAYKGQAEYPIEETDGKPFEEPELTPVVLPPLAEVAKKWGVSVEYVAHLPGAYGTCNIGATEIKLVTDDVAVFFHELSHAAHKRIKGDLKGGQDVEQETVAEFTATVLMMLYGFGDRTGNAWRYISMYATDPLEAIGKAMMDIQKVLALLLNGGETDEGETENE